MCVELASDSRDVMSTAYKPTRQNVHGGSSVPRGYRPADKVQFGKPRVVVLFCIILITQKGK